MKIRISAAGLAHSLSNAGTLKQCRNGGNMFIHEVCKACGLTKKAVEYYMEQGLVRPSVKKNGYRDFSEEDVERLKRISVLRGLGIAVADIRGILSGQEGALLNKASLETVSYRKRMEAALLQEKQKLIAELSTEQNWERIQEKLWQLERKQTILERLRQAFPGSYGSYICMHFAMYLNEPVVTTEQQEAFNTIIAFLDTVDFDIPEELQQYLDEAVANCDEAFAERLSVEMDTAVRDMEGYLVGHREIIEDYMAFKQSEEYRNTPVYQMEQALRQFGRTSGYNEIFLPAMCRLSRSYREYQEKLGKANEVFLRKYPNGGEAP